MCACTCTDAASCSGSHARTSAWTEHQHAASKSAASREGQRFRGAAARSKAKRQGIRASEGRASLPSQQNSPSPGGSRLHGGPAGEGGGDGDGCCAGEASLLRGGGATNSGRRTASGGDEEGGAPVCLFHDGLVSFLSGGAEVVGKGRERSWSRRRRFFFPRLCLLLLPPLFVYFLATAPFRPGLLGLTFSPFWFLCGFGFSSPASKWVFFDRRD